MRGVVLSVGSCLLISAPAASAAPVAIRASASAHELRLHGPAVTATLTLRTRERAETVAVGLEPSLWPDRLIGASDLLGLERPVPRELR